MPVSKDIPSLAVLPLNNAALAASFAASERITRTRAANFYHGLRLCPEPKRSALYSVYAWTREADDAVDDAPSPEQARERLREFRAKTETALHGRFGEPPGFWPAFAHTVLTYPIDRRWLDELLRGVEQDITPAQPPTDAILDEYCARVASTVGRLCVAIWGLQRGVDRAEADRLAADVGLAFQRINILRDFAADFDSRPRRVYLSTESFARSGLTPEQLRVWSSPARCAGMVREQSAHALRQLASAERLTRMIDARCAPVLAAMTAIYGGILARIVREPSLINTPNGARLPSWRKAILVGEATARLKLRAIFGAGAVENQA